MTPAVYFPSGDIYIIFLVAVDGYIKFFSLIFCNQPRYLVYLCGFKAM